MRILKNCNKTEVCEEDNIGWGVRATDDIRAGEIIEEVPFVAFSRYTILGKNVYNLLNQVGFLSEEEKYMENLKANLGLKDPESYFFKWLPDVPLNGKQHPFTVLPSGNSWLYNSSNCSNNIGWRIVKDKEKYLFVFSAEKEIKKGEFLRSFFGYFLGEQGQIFPCVSAFGLGLDWFEGKVRCKAIRFGSVEEFEAAKTNPAVNRLGQIFQLSKDSGFAVTRVSAMLPSGEEKAAAEFPDGVSLTTLYSKIQEFYNSAFSLIKITVTYEDKNSNQPVTESVIFKK